MVLVVLIAVVPAYAVVTLSPTPSPLPGNTFQAADGNQVGAAGLTD